MRTEPIHRMNLKGPWQYEWIDGPHSGESSAESVPDDGSPLLTDFRVRMPSSLEVAFGRVSGRIRLRRRFQRPTNLDDNERVHVAFAGIGGRAKVSVNGKAVGSVTNNSETVSFEMTQLLEHSNELAVDLTFEWDKDQSPGGLFKPVAIEIHRVYA